eukprot:4765652-Pyramimonas_sp.AAC.2
MHSSFAAASSASLSPNESRSRSLDSSSRICQAVDSAAPSDGCSPPEIYAHVQELTVKALSSHLITCQFNSPTSSLRTPLGLDTDTVQLTLSSHLVTRKVNSPTHSLRTSYVRNRAERVI